MRYILPWVSLSCLFASALGSERWNMHTIDRSSRGADGVRLADVDRDGRLDIVTGWEDSRRIRICFQPTVDRATERWLSVEVGRVKSSEDAVYADVNNDGWLDVISCCEGTRERSIFTSIPEALGRAHVVA